MYVTIFFCYFVKSFCAILCWSSFWNVKITEFFSVYPQKLLLRLQAAIVCVFKTNNSLHPEGWQNVNWCQPLYLLYAAFYQIRPKNQRYKRYIRKQEKITKKIAKKWQWPWSWWQVVFISKQLPYEQSTDTRPQKTEAKLGLLLCHSSMGLDVLN